MVHGRDQQLATVHVPQRVKRMEKRGGIRPARAGHEHATGAFEQAAFAQCRMDLRDQPRRRKPRSDQKRPEINGTCTLVARCCESPKR